MIKLQDAALWDELKGSVQPLDCGVAEQDLPPRLRVRRAPPKPLAYCLDLHRMTLQEAHVATLQFILKHYKRGSKHIQIITGKGIEGKGAIRSEFAGWLDTRSFKEYIREWKWTNDEGAADLWLKKNKSF